MKVFLLWEVGFHSEHTSLRIEIEQRHEYHETGYGKYWEIDPAVEDEKRRVGCGAEDLLRLSRSLWRSDRKAVCPPHTRKIGGWLHYIH